ncbi:uncharacterized protein UTRI_03647_B [Ustilago trichophora]|uniref:AB hydrolase-1 domain-containing protein n=1 Tax=Ustilago trichophora TaxID=86804 RepID=A0A5C3DZE7_9BASI|nr:uncharacterized protein UTRI_03647_B [Ustilago trichophora]
MRETKLHIPMTTATGETIGIVGILAQIALPPHNPQEHEPHPMYTSRSTTSPIEPLRYSQPSSPSSYSYRPDISNDPSSSSSHHHRHPDNPSLSVEDDPATMQRLRHKDQAFKRRGYPIYPIDKRDTRGLKIAIILHGVLAHKDQIYHKQLARALPVDSFRFDFRANGETPGTWSMGNLADDVEDLVAVVDYLRTKLEYTVEIIIGHSRGGLDGFAWFAKHCPDALPPNLRVPFFVALSARFNMANIHERDPVYLPAFAQEGFFRWQARVAGQDKEVHVFPEQVEQFAAWPTREIALAFPYNTDVLLIHGTADKSVPASDVASYSNILSGVHRRPGSCSVKLIDYADHLFRGFYPQVVEAIVEWLQERSELTKMGLSAAAIRDRDTLGLARFNPSHFHQGRVGPQMWDNNLAGQAAGGQGGQGGQAAQGQGPPWLDSRNVQNGPSSGEASPYARYLSASAGASPNHNQQGGAAQVTETSHPSQRPQTTGPSITSTTIMPSPIPPPPSSRPTIPSPTSPSLSSSSAASKEHQQDPEQKSSWDTDEVKATPPPILVSSPHAKSRL